MLCYISFTLVQEAWGILFQLNMPQPGGLHMKESEWSPVKDEKLNGDHNKTND